MARTGADPRRPDGAATSRRPATCPGISRRPLRAPAAATDSAGQPWAGRSLAGDDAKIHNFEDDDGTADAGYLAAVAALSSGGGDEAAVVASLATARVFVPIVAQLAEEAEGVRTGCTPTSRRTWPS